ncbi:MAG TPA: AAA family ATPase [Dehalococcoidia bacterium]|nr:AAA family ATPase [Dehalococcoidia bacterium]
MRDRIESISIQAFRGIPESFALDLGGRSCVVLGENATGKSTIADAIEWYYTGTVDFLTREGREGAIRHSGARPELETRVEVQTDGNLSGFISRSHTSPNHVKAVGKSELFLLRGRTLAEFVDKTKAEKWQVLAELLGLEEIDRLRLDLQKVRNELDAAVQRWRNELHRRENALKMPSDGAVSENTILQAFRQHCEQAGITPPRSLDDALSPTWIQQAIPTASREEKAARLQNLANNVQAILGDTADTSRLQDWNQFVAQTGNVDSARIDLLKAADRLIGSGHARNDECPLCHQPFTLASLQSNILRELQALEQARQALDAARRLVVQPLETIRGWHAAFSRIRKEAEEERISLPALPPDMTKSLEAAIDRVEALDIEVVDGLAKQLKDWGSKTLQSIRAAIPAPTSNRDRALIAIGTLQEAAKQWREAARELDNATAALALADRLHSTYQRRETAHFQETVANISDTAASIYDALHHEQGVDAVALETIGEKGMEISVRFYGRKELPPHRVLSESHLNSLGLALFLAMARSLNERLGFLVLDDVVSSFDREHRGRLAELLTGADFEDTQLIILTHDEQFYTQIERRAPSWLKVEFTSWSYGAGPRVRKYDVQRFLDHARQALQDDDKVGAAQKGRRALEEFMQEACERLESPLPFRRGHRNDRRELGELIGAFRRTLKEIAKPLLNQIDDLLRSVESDVQAIFNVESHASLSAASTTEVRDAITRTTKLISHFTCQSCKTRVWHEGSAKTARCRCGQHTFPPSDGGGPPERG